MDEFAFYNRRNFLRNLLVLGAGASLASLPQYVQAKDSSVKITILHTNDVHSRIEPFPMDGSALQGRGGVARRSTLIQQIRAEEPHVLLFDAGDFFQGTPYFNLFDGQLELELMSKLGYDAATFGNHEFDNGLQGLSKHFDKANFPFVSSNYDFTGTVLERKINEYLIFQRGGVKIGVFAVGIDLEGLVDPNSYKGMTITDPIAVAEQYTRLLKNDLLCDLIICLSHLGYSYENEKVSDLKLAAHSRHIDLIIGGHTHTFLERPTEVRNLDGHITLVNQTGRSGVYLGRLDFLFDRATGRSRIVANNYVIDAQLDRTT